MGLDNSSEETCATVLLGRGSAAVEDDGYSPSLASATGKREAVGDQSDSPK